MRVAITGASGFTGRYVADALSEAGMEPVPLEADLRDRTAIVRAVETVEFDCLIHLAARAFVDANDWRSFYAVNQFGTFNLLDAVADIRPSTRCILASSAQVYGPTAQGLITENTPLRPANHYGISKRAMEEGGGLWRDKLDIIITRPFNYTGIGQDRLYLIPKIVDHFRRKATTIELGNLWVQRDFGDVRAVARAYAGLAARAELLPETVNLATGIVHSIESIISLLSEITGHQMEVKVNPSFVRENDVAVLGGDVGRLRKILPDWKPIEMRDTLTWMVNNARLRRL